MGSIFSGETDSVMGDWRKEKTALESKLSITYKSHVLDNKNTETQSATNAKAYNITFNVSAQNLNSTEAYIFISRIGENPMGFATVQINPNGQTSVVTPFYILNLDTVLDYTLSATINCDNMKANTQVFSLKEELKKCFCKRDLTEEEVKTIIVSLRKKNGYKGLSASALFDFNEKSNPHKRIEHLENVTFESLTLNLNKVFHEFKIDTCIRKIHFIAQTYHESMSYKATFEGRNENNTPSNYKGGYAFQGRGIKQITHDYNYLEYYDYKKGTSLFKLYIKKRSGYQGVTEYLNSTKNNGFEEGFLDNLKIFAKRLSTEIDSAFNSAGWFWQTNKLNKYADADDVLKLSEKINGYRSNKLPNGYAERKKYTSELKQIMKYEKCSNKN